jgi:hypothetical protein
MGILLLSLQFCSHFLIRSVTIPNEFDGLATLMLKLIIESQKNGQVNGIILNK